MQRTQDNAARRDGCDGSAPPGLRHIHPRPPHRLAFVAWRHDATISDRGHSPHAHFVVTVGAINSDFNWLWLYDHWRSSKDTAGCAIDWNPRGSRAAWSVTGA